MTINCAQAIEVSWPDIVFGDRGQDSRYSNFWRHSGEEEKNGEISAAKGRNQETMEYEKSLCGPSCS